MESVSPGQHRQNNDVQKPSVGRKIGGVAAGLGVSGAIELVPHELLSGGAVHKMKALRNSITADEFQKITNNALDAIKTTGLNKKGVEILNADVASKEAILEVIKKEYGGGIQKFMPKYLKNKQTDNMVYQVFNGMNSFFAPKSNKIITSDTNILASFHEIGHAMNKNMGTFSKALQSARNLSLLVLPITLVALLKTKKADNEKPKNGIDKAGDFVKKNAGKLTFAALLPMVLEEGLASIKGNKIAKQSLDSALYKKVAKSNALGFVTYAGLAILSGVGIHFGVKLKDKIAQNKANKAGENK